MLRLRRVLAIVTLASGVSLLVTPRAFPQQLDSTLYAGLRYRFIGPEGNRASAVAGEPGNPLVAYVGAASGGIWKTSDGGVNWTPVFDREPAQAIGALAIAQSEPNVVWAGTGEAFFIRPMTSLGDGVYRSTDAGKSWLHVGLDQTGRTCARWRRRRPGWDRADRSRCGEFGPSGRAPRGASSCPRRWSGTRRRRVRRWAGCRRAAH